MYALVASSLGARPLDLASVERELCSQLLMAMVWKLANLRDNTSDLPIINAFGFANVDQADSLLQHSAQRLNVLATQPRSLATLGLHLEHRRLSSDSEGQSGRDVSTMTYTSVRIHQHASCCGLIGNSTFHGGARLLNRSVVGNFAICGQHCLDTLGCDHWSFHRTRHNCHLCAGCANPPLPLSHSSFQILPKDEAARTVARQQAESDASQLKMLTCKRQRLCSPLVKSSGIPSALPTLDPSRYFSLLVLNAAAAARYGGKAGDIWMFSRTGEWPDSKDIGVRTHVWRGCSEALDRKSCGVPVDITRSIVRAVGTESSSNLCKGPQAAHCDDEALAANAAPALVNGTVLLFGGLYSHGGKAFMDSKLPLLKRGILLYEAHNASAFDNGLKPSGSGAPRPGWTINRTPILDGAHPGCMEARHKYAPFCEFDGRISLAWKRNIRSRESNSAASASDLDVGEWCLYARANVVRGLAGIAGGRHVQVARAPSAHGPWGNFSLIEIDNYTTSPQRNFYSVSVKPNPVATHTLLGLFAYYDTTTKDAYIGLALTCDGSHFSKLHPLLGSRVSFISYNTPRIADHPVDGFVQADADGTAFYMYVHTNVPGIASRGSRLERYVLDADHLRAYTREQVRTLPTCRHREARRGTA